ncbi:ribonuclease E inhibitor RraB [Planomicrobium sp. MB-3u-38]|uniref:ribonuclease E inhibitor RraB n=1 Tax=Planomicrobium sp. MB-3u-38 TaxID=2058318 RepID=UPI000C7BB6E9|nr:ribonuclease E inhibitor RraB [Planomicrobium sp. MB-3u-38]PKH09754.1 ribonuclease E inhibitor RraB [Planomicrobium sp. MB-3u-38]
MNLLPKKFPNDEDGKVLKLLYKEGIDFTQTYQVDFLVAVPDKKNGDSILHELKKNGFSCVLEQDDESKEWICYCEVEMLLTHEGVTNIQKQLNKLSEPYNAYSDGWGVMIN